MLSSTNIGLELPRDIDPCVKWKTAPKGRRRGARRGRDSSSGDSNRQKAAVTSSNGSENASDEDFKEADQVLASESEKLSVTILGRRFSDTVQSVPIKKRMRLQTGSSAALPLDGGQASTPEAGLDFPAEDSSLDHHIDFSGISILAEAACKSDEDTNDIPVSEPTAEVQSPTTSKGENGVVMPEEGLEIIKSPKYDCTSVPSEVSPTHVVTTEVVNNGPEKSSKPENVSRGLRLHWDLNTVMDAWDCDQQEGDDGADYEQKSTVVSCNTEICNDLKEEADKDGTEAEAEQITCRNDGDVPELALPKSELHGTELRKEGAISTEVAAKDPIMESIIPPTDCSSLTTPSCDLSLTKEEVENQNEPYSNQLSATEHEQLSVSKPDEMKEEIELAGSATEKPFEVEMAGSFTEKPFEVEMGGSVTEKPFEVDPLMEATTGPELILEACIKEPVAGAPGSEPNDAMMDNDDTRTNAMMGGNIVEHDSMAVDDKLDHDALQANCDQLSEEKNQADLQHIETVLMPTIDNGNGNTTDEKVDQQVDLTASHKFSMEVDRHGNSVEFQSDHNHSDFYPPKKDLEEDDYQYEDGELREPAMHYWETDGFKLAENEHGPHGGDELGDKQAVTLDPPQSEENLLVTGTSVQPDNGMDNNVIVKMDMESKDQIELLQNGQANNSSKNESAEYMHNSKLKIKTGWDKQPDSLRRNSESPSEQENVAGASSLRVDTALSIDTLRSSDDPHRNDMPFVRSRRSKEDELDERVELIARAPRMHERGMPSRNSDTSRREEHWVETRINTGRTRHRTTEFGAPSYAPSNSGNATAASIAKVKSNGFMVAPDGTLVKANGSCSTRKCQNSSSFFQGSPTERDHRGLGSSRERMVSPGRFGGIRGSRTGRCAVESREQFHRPTIEISPDRRRQRSFSPHRGHMRHISPSHIESPSRLRTRSPNAWVSPPARGRCLADHEPRHERGRSPIHRMRPDYDDRIGAPNLVHSNHHHHFPPHGLRCVNDRRCTSPGNIMRSPPRNARFYQLDSPLLPLHRQRDEFYHHPVHSARCNGFDHRRGFEEERYDLVHPERTFHRNMNGDRFRPHNSSQKSFDSHRRSPPRGFNRGLVGDVNHRSKEDRDGFKFVTGGRHNNGKYEKREMRDRSSGGDDATARRRLP